MKSIIHKILSLAMAFVVLFSTLSFTINMHYCGGALVDTAIFKKVKSCGMEMQNPSSEGCSVTKMNCCDDKSVAVDGQDELQLTIDKISFEQQIFVVSFVYTYINLFEGLNKKAYSFEAYIPPLVIRQIYKIDETYLI
jgi:hypothetical protein